MRAKRRLLLVLSVCGALVVAGAISVAPEVLLVYRSFSYVFGRVEPPAGPYEVAFGFEGPGELRGGPGDDLLASEGPWGQSPEDYRPDRLHGGEGDDYLDAVSYPYPSVDVVRCGPGEDAVVADPRDDVGGDCETVRHVDLARVPQIGDPLWEFPPEVGLREYGPNPRPGGLQEE